ncbi:MAG: hypothetical protein ACP5KN_21155 [Armatimonadota bacterium]
MHLSFASLEEARARLLGFGGAVEVVSPRALRLSMVDYGRRIASVYGRQTASDYGRQTASVYGRQTASDSG